MMWVVIKIIFFKNFFGHIAIDRIFMVNKGTLLVTLL